MKGINIVIQLSVIVSVILTSAITSCSAAISDRRLCYDPKCSEPVSLGYTLMNYRSNDPRILSFKSNTDVKVFSKSAGKRVDLWGVEINGKRGYVPVHMIREKTILRKKLIHNVPTEEIIGNSDANSKNDDVPKDPQKIDNNVDEAPTEADAPQRSILDKLMEEVVTSLFPEPSQISPSFEVHDGTTIPVAVNDVPHQPSYSTDAPQNSAEIDQHPILSVHPNIASSVTLKNEESENTIDDDSEKSINSEESKKVEKVLTNDELKDEITNALIEHNEDYPNETNSQDSSANNEFRLNQETISNSDESSSEAGTPAEEKSYVSNIIDKANNEKSFDSDDIVNVADNDEKESKDEQLHEEEKTNDTKADPEEKKQMIEESFNQQHEEAKTPEILLDQNLGEQMITGEPTKYEEKPTTEALEKSVSDETAEIESPETTLKPDISESPEAESNLEKINTNETESPQNDERIIHDATDSTKVDEVTENRVNEPDGSSLVANTLESSQIDTKILEKDIEASENIGATEKSFPVGENSAEKSPEEEPRNLNVMNPIFSRLSMLPSMVKEIVGDSLSNSETKTVKEDISEEPLANFANEEIQVDDMNTNIGNLSDNNNDTDDTRGVDNSLGFETSSKDDAAEAEVIERSNEQNLVNTVDSNNNNNVENRGSNNNSTADSTEASHEVIVDNSVQPGIYEKDDLSGIVQDNVAVDRTSSFNGFPANRNLLNVGSGLQPDDHKSSGDSSEKASETIDEFQNPENDPETIVSPDLETKNDATETPDPCLVDNTCQKPEGLEENHSFVHEVEDSLSEGDIDIADVIAAGRNYWETLTYLVVTAFTALLFSLGYYYIENTRRDGQYIAKINQLEKQLLVCSKECAVLDDTLKSTKTKLDSIEDQSFGSNEMVASLKADLESANTAKSELEDQVAMLEKELESATEAGLGLERMLREILSTNNEDNPLAQSVEDLQMRLNAQQAANEALTNALNLKAQENETLNVDLKTMTLKCEQLEVEVTRITEELKHQNILKTNLEHKLLEKVENLEIQVKEITAERLNLRKQLKSKEMEMTDLLEVVNQMNINNLDLEKLYNVSKVKAEASQLLEERDELKIRLSEVEGAHQLLEEHVKLINEEVSSLSEQCKLAEKAKRDAETRVEVLSNFFKEKEAQRQKEEAVWLQKQGEVSSTVERLHAMQNEIHNYKQQIEMLKREILDQEREYKNQISTLETKAHENWVLARQNERRLEESKAEAGQLRNRLTMIEKNLNDIDPEAKLHRLEANGETPTSPQLFIGAEASSSPIMFTGSSGVPLPPPPSYLYGPPVPPFIPPPPHSSSGITPFEVGQRPPPLGGRLSSPPPLHSVNSGRYENPRSPPPPLSPSYRPTHRGFLPPFPNERIHPPPPIPPHSTHLPPPLNNSSSRNWGDDTLPPPPRNSGFQPHQPQHQQQHHHHHPQHHHHQRDNQQRSRNRKGSLHSSGESLDKNL